MRLFLTTARSFSDMVLTSSPPRRYEPCVGMSRQPRMFMSVDLPEPDGPVIAMYSPSSTLSVIPRNASNVILPVLYVLRTSEISTIADTGDQLPCEVGRADGPPTPPGAPPTPLGPAPDGNPPDRLPNGGRLPLPVVVDCTGTTTSSPSATPLVISVRAPNVRPTVTSVFVWTPLLTSVTYVWPFSCCTAAVGTVSAVTSLTTIVTSADPPTYSPVGLPVRVTMIG